MKLIFEKDPHCEHCGQLEPYTAIFDDDGCTWCVMCSQEIGNEIVNITEIRIAECERKIDYFDNRIDDIEDYLNELLDSQK